MVAYLVEVGVLIDKTNEDYETYSNAYDKQRGYYDENQYYKKDKESAINDVKEYVKNGVENTYGVVSETQLNDDLINLLDEIPVENESYEVEDVLYSSAKIDGKIEENIIRE